MKNIFGICFSILLLSLTGCITSMNQEDVRKAINAKPGEQLYTAYNIHYRGDACQA